MEDYPETMEDVFMDFKGRRTGLINALTIDRANLCLFGHPNGNWEVNLPDEEVPSHLPEPALGINFARPDHGSPDRHWISLVAFHSDAWLLSVAFYFAARCGFGKADREHLFDMINEIPSIHEAVIQFEKKRSDSNLSNEAKTNSEVQGSESQEEHSGPASPEEDHEDIDEGNEDNYVPGDFWIFCDMCEKWSHGRCVGMTIKG